MTKVEFERLSMILRQDPWKVRPALEKFLQEAEVTENTERRTDPQNRAIHLWLSQIASELDKDGHTMQDVVKAIRRAEIRPTMIALKECVWKPYQFAALGTDSTTKLKKEEVDKVYEGLNKFFSNTPFHIHVPFPSAAFTHYNEYPEYTGKPTI